MKKLLITLTFILSTISMADVAELTCDCSSKKMTIATDLDNSNYRVTTSSGDKLLLLPKERKLYVNGKEENIEKALKVLEFNEHCILHHSNTLNIKRGEYIKNNLTK